MRTLGISEFKARCIDELKAVQRTGEPLVVTLRKQPIVSIHQYRETPAKRVLGKLRGRLTIHDDIVRSDSEEEWEMEA
jgi:hypothetical protein